MYSKSAPLLTWLWLAASATAQTSETPPRDKRATREVAIARVVGSTRVETSTLQLTDEDGRPNLAALDDLSILARPKGIEAPSLDGGLERRLARLHPGLLTRLAALAARFPGRTIEIVSGYRPEARPTSRHRHGRALDIRMEGVSRAHLSEVARTLPETGVGYYPNSTFTHIDVRAEQAYWVDRSAPGEEADYGPAAIAPDELEEERRKVLSRALLALSEIRAPRQEAEPATEPRLLEHRPMDPGEVRKLRDELIRGIRSLATIAQSVARSGSGDAGLEGE